jgi:hypothetical protein
LGLAADTGELARLASMGPGMPTWKRPQTIDEFIGKYLMPVNDSSTV